MPGFDMLGVDLDALHNTITTLRTCADTLQQQSRRITEHPFGLGNDEAGRNYSAQGAAIHAGLERMAACLHHWSAGTAATADVFAHAATEYERIDRERADAISAVHP
ncbi:hypothetical protein GFY24_14925 [Nocardia sp. SYP-A9097]|uniref:hypothetical protein n=1 Tax=Nocardia sp. SYP-A9097 TaxID=2663237 RepID=UPI00129A52FE|nr:hypothetical protein [Nocardia sp. SYP-A9097]MRH88721.1 hypothetical protein [Nocardia sp. SYP-A9097]